MDRHILISGDLVNGFRFTGPFTTSAEAMEGAGDNFMVNWQVAPLHVPGAGVSGIHLVEADEPEPDDKPAHLILVGNPVEGMTFCGPFESADAAVAHASDEFHGELWHVAPLRAD